MIKKLFSAVIALVLVQNCSSSRNDEQVDQPDAASSAYMKTIYPQNSDCVDQDYLKLTVGGKSVEVNYGQYDNGLQLCHFAEHNFGGNICESCDGHMANMQFPTADMDITPNNFPVKTGSLWYADPKFKVTGINFHGLYIFIQIPDRLINNLKTGVYRLSTSSNEKREPGVNFNLNWEIVDNSGAERAETGYALTVDREKPYQFELVCIDRSVPKKIRLTWKFNATFAGRSFETNDPKNVYSTPVEGKVSYNIELP